MVMELGPSFEQGALRAAFDNVPSVPDSPKRALLRSEVAKTRKGKYSL